MTVIRTWTVAIGSGGVWCETDEGKKPLHTVLNEGAGVSLPISIDDVSGLQAALDGKLSASGPAVPVVTAPLPADLTTTLSTFSDATGLALTLAANKLYRFEFFLNYSTAATTTGIGLAFSGPAKSLFAAKAEMSGQSTNGVDSIFAGHIADYDPQAVSQVTSGAVVAAGTKYLATIQGVIRTTAAGNLQLKYRTEVADSGATIHADSIGYLSTLA